MTDSCQPSDDRGRLCRVVRWWIGPALVMAARERVTPRRPVRAVGASKGAVCTAWWPLG